MIILVSIHRLFAYLSCFHVSVSITFSPNPIPTLFEFRNLGYFGHRLYGYYLRFASTIPAFSLPVRFSRLLG
jgi:hypothetical protein